MATISSVEVQLIDLKPSFGQCLRDRFRFPSSPIAMLALTRVPYRSELALDTSTLDAVLGHAARGLVAMPIPALMAYPCSA